MYSPLAANQPVQCVLFDLDGTLVDSEADIASALDCALAQCGCPTIGSAGIASFVGDGARVLVERALSAVGAPLAATDDVLDAYLTAYRENHLRFTRPYPGVLEMLAELESRGIACGVVTNKPVEFSVSIVQAMGFVPPVMTVIGGDSLDARKPSPKPILAALEACGVLAANSVMVGDGETDMKAGQAAGLFTVGVLWGFRSHDTLRSAGADIVISTMTDLPGVLFDGSRR